MEFSQEAVEEAGLFGVQYMWACGYDPNALNTFIGKLQTTYNKDSNITNTLFKRYSLTDSRLRRSRELLARFPDRSEYTINTSDFIRVKTHLISLSRKPVEFRSKSIMYDSCYREDDGSIICKLRVSYKAIDRDLSLSLRSSKLLIDAKNNIFTSTETSLSSEQREERPTLKRRQPNSLDADPNNGRPVLRNNLFTISNFTSNNFFQPRLPSQTDTFYRDVRLKFTGIPASIERANIIQIDFFDSVGASPIKFCNVQFSSSKCPACKYLK